MFEDLRWLGIEWSEGPDCGGSCGPYAQSERRGLYLEAWKKLLDQGVIYPCTCSRKDVGLAVGAPNEGDDEPVYPGTCRPQGSASYVSGTAPLRGRGTAEAAVSTCSQPRGANWRFRVPDGEEIYFADLHRGAQRFVAGRDFGDFIIWRRDDVPAYQLAVVVDDAAMRVTEVVRGADLLKSTARQILLFHALGLPVPDYYHCDLVRDEAGVRLAKRHDSLSIRKLRELGWTAERVRARSCRVESTHWMIASRFPRELKGLLVPIQAQDSDITPRATRLRPFDRLRADFRGTAEADVSTWVDPCPHTQRVQSLTSTMNELSSSEPSPRKLIIAIDGPAGAGKSTIASRLARKLGYVNLESGAMYRALALKAIERDASFDDESALVALAQKLRIELEPTLGGNRTLMDGRDVSSRIRERDVSEGASRVSVHPKVREWMVAHQREMGAGGGIVMEGRDIGTKVFPDADLKIFLDADPVVREQRRMAQQKIKGDVAASVAADLRERDLRDRTRAVSPLAAAADAVLIDSSVLSEDQVLARVEELVGAKQRAGAL